MKYPLFWEYFFPTIIIRADGLKRCSRTSRQITAKNIPKRKGRLSASALINSTFAFFNLNLANLRTC